LGCKKGFLLKDLNILIPGIKSYGIENHTYALKKSVKCKSKLILSDYYKIPFKNKYFDFVIAFNSLYMQNLGDVIKSLKEIERVSKKSYIVLASGETDEERKTGKKGDYKTDPKARISDVAWITDQWVYDTIWPFMQQANEKAGWGYHIKAAESMQITRYR